MRGRHNQYRKRSSDVRNGTAGAVVCGFPRCGYRLQHLPGIPCRNYVCPDCGIPLTRMEGYEIPGNVFPERKVKNDRIQRQSDEKGNELMQKSTERKQAVILELPFIDPGKCVGCGICVDYCPRNALSIKEGIAAILADNCINCRICVKKCPEGAIY